MGVFQRNDSPYWWLWLETTKQREKTHIPIGETVAQRKDSKKLAQQIYFQRMNELGSRLHRLPPSRDKMPTFDQFSQWYETHVMVHHKGRDREREMLPRLREHFGRWTLDAITKDKVIEWRTWRRSTSTTIEHFGGPNGPRRRFPPPSARTVNREVDLLQQILKAAVPTHLQGSPIDGLPDLKVVPPIRRTMSVDEERLVLAVMRPDDQAILVCALDTMSRLSDVLDLRRNDDHGRTLDIRDPKNGRPHTVPISSRLRVALDAVEIDDRKPEWYFPRRRGAETERDRRNGYIQAFRRACLKAGVPYGRAKRGLTFHWATRRTGATRMIRAGGDGAIATAQRIGNWKDPSVLIGVYQETITAEMEAAVEAVGAGVSEHATRGSITGILTVVPKNQKNNA
jgi:integrase